MHLKECVTIIWIVTIIIIYIAGYIQGRCDAARNNVCPKKTRQKQNTFV